MKSVEPVRQVSRGSYPQLGYLGHVADGATGSKCIGNTLIQPAEMRPRADGDVNLFASISGHTACASRVNWQPSQAGRLAVAPLGPSRRRQGRMGSTSRWRCLQVLSQYPTMRTIVTRIAARGGASAMAIGATRRSQLVSAGRSGTRRMTLSVRIRVERRTGRTDEVLNGGTPSTSVGQPVRDSV